MKPYSWILGSAFLFALAASSGARADTVVNLAVVTSDAVVDSQNRMIPFELQATVDENGDLTGMTYYGDGESHHFTLAQVRHGAVLKHDSGHNLDVLTLFGASIDPRDGGAGDLHFLYNGASGSTGDFGMEIDRLGSSWALYTDRDHGHRLIHSLFLKKHDVFVLGTVGIDHIEAN